MKRSGHALGRIHVLWVGYMCVFIKIPYVEVIRVQPFTGWSVGFSAKTVLKKIIIIIINWGSTKNGGDFVWLSGWLWELFSMKKLWI